MPQQKWFEVTYASDSTESLDIIGLPGYSHIKLGSTETLGTGSQLWEVESAVVSAPSLSDLRRTLRAAFGYNYESLVYHRIREVK